MHHQIFIKIPVVDVAKAAEFYKAIGFSVTAPDVIMGIPALAKIDLNFGFSVILLKADHFENSIQNNICDATQNTEIILGMMLNSLAECKAMLDKVVAAGGKNLGSTWGAGVAFQDLDGHLWHIVA
jgi:predicted lactoylglutathione lyase